jgi:hypothetical protein
MSVLSRLSLESYTSVTPPFHGGNTGSNPVRVATVSNLRFPEASGSNRGSTEELEDHFQPSFLVSQLGKSRQKHGKSSRKVVASGSL